MEETKYESDFWTCGTAGPEAVTLQREPALDTMLKD